MELTLSPRLFACAGLIRVGDRVADVGCDHGYLSIYLLKQKIASQVIAADIRPGPLQAAVANAGKHGVSQNITFHLSDGVQNIPRDFDVLVCAGMGADTMISILDSAPWLQGGQYRLVLQCQSKTPMLRRYLYDNGWSIRKETALKDGRFLYTVMEVVFAPSPSLTPGQQYFPPVLMDGHDESTRAYLHQTIHKLTLSVNGKGVLADPEERIALKELQKMEETPW